MCSALVSVPARNSPPASRPTRIIEADPLASAECKRFGVGGEVGATVVAGARLRARWALRAVGLCNTLRCLVVGFFRSLFRLALAIGLACSTTAIPSLAGGQNTSSDPSKKPIAQKCLDDIHAFEKELAGIRFGVVPPRPGVTDNQTFSEQFYGYGMAPTPRRQIRMLHDAALVYAYAGNESLCEQTLASMRAIYDQHQKPVGIESDDPNITLAWRRAHLARSKQVAEMNHLMQASTVIGAEIRNLKDQRLGEITDIILNPAKQDILYVIASYGGFLGFGEKLLAIRWTDLRATADHELYVLDVSPHAFDAAPAVGPANFAETADPAWQRALAQYWDHVLKK